MKKTCCKFCKHCKGGECGAFTDPPCELACSFLNRGKCKIEKPDHCYSCKKFKRKAAKEKR